MNRRIFQPETHDTCGRDEETPVTACSGGSDGIGDLPMSGMHYK